jgi:hypothetical protein
MARVNSYELVATLNNAVAVAVAVVVVLMFLFCVFVYSAAFVAPQYLPRWGSLHASALCIERLQHDVM